MKDFLSLASRRQSDRAFDPQRPVEKEKLQRILEAACIAPSACNSQPWHFIVVDKKEKKEMLSKMCMGTEESGGRRNFEPCFGNEPFHQTGARTYLGRGGEAESDSRYRLVDQGQEFLPSGYRHNGRSPCAGCRR